MNEDLKLSDLLECPFCGYDEFMLIGKPKGEVRYRQNFNGMTSRHSEDMFDRVEVDYTKQICGRCGRYLGNPKTDTCGARLVKLLTHNIA